MELARRTDKPILLHKANIGSAAGRIAASHTAALAADDRVVDAALRQVGDRPLPQHRDAGALPQGAGPAPAAGQLAWRCCRAPAATP